MDVLVQREDDGTTRGARYVVEVISPGHRGTVGTFDEATTPGAERLARACAIRIASALRCRVTRA
jgi:hypothetical protein